MTTAQDLIDSSAKQAGILAEGQSLEGGINTDALNRLNRMLDRWQNDGIDLGLSNLAASDTIYVDDADEEAIELNLTLRLMVRHRRPISPGLSQAGQTALTELQAKYANITEMSLDNALTRDYLPHKRLSDAET
jgi:hypothetical protein